MGKKNKNWKNNQQNNENTEHKELEKGIVLKAFIHCEGCSDKISKCLKRYDGVKHVTIDRENHRIVVKGEVKDPMKVLERLRNKYSKNVELISPLPKPENKRKDPEKKEQVKVLKTVMLKMLMHCEGCAIDVRRTIEKMEGVDSVELDKENSLVIVRGAMESTKLVNYVKKKLGKHSEIMKEDNRREAAGEMRVNERGNEPIIMFSYPPQYSTQYLYPNQTFSDENVFACSIM